MITGIVVPNGIHYFHLLPLRAMYSNFLWLHDLCLSLTGLICPGDRGVIIQLCGLQMTAGLCACPDAVSMTQNPWAWGPGLKGQLLAKVPAGAKSLVLVDRQGKSDRDLESLHAVAIRESELFANTGPPCPVTHCKDRISQSLGTGSYLHWCSV